MNNLLESQSTIRVATFYIGNQLLGIDISKVQEINNDIKISNVPLSDEIIAGVINLRGEIVTVLNLKEKLQIDSDFGNEKKTVLIIKSDELNNSHERTGFLVDKVADVIEIQTKEIESSPANLVGIDGKYFEGVCKFEQGLLILIDLNEILK